MQVNHIRRNLNLPKPEEGTDILKKFISDKLSTILLEHEIRRKEIYIPRLGDHTTNIVHIPSTQQARNEFLHITNINGQNFSQREKTDGVILTNETLIEGGILQIVGDCAVISFEDRGKEVVGSIHSGWKGTAKDITGNLVERLKDLLGNKSLKDIIFEVSPHAMSCCYEFGEQDFLQNFKKNPLEPELPGLLERYSIKPEEIAYKASEGKVKLDILKTLLLVLQKNGVDTRNISSKNICTICRGHKKGYYSSRKDINKRFGVLTYST
ncbi:polyphenol oxidase family protein [Candidatus Absconditicoccus praedator]|uniref:polyphenol oxidase family protein n=1 Tax=Candidatus Absconditicoccus praedator TaxID=2735562 RepID=UPI001E54C027|nr:polyphenol oxidase family protein [Candidatus Absconditicoccus praedator]UFX82912.1 polyphenol oxidase family protein [Candidatus Absconditicoccus praedator]